MATRTYKRGVDAKSTGQQGLKMPTYPLVIIGWGYGLSGGVASDAAGAGVGDSARAGAKSGAA